MISVSPASDHMGCSGGCIPWLSNYVVALTNQGEWVNTKDQERSLLWILGAIYAAVIEHAGWKNIFCQLADFFKVNASVPVCSYTDVKCYSSRSILAIALVCLLPYYVEAASLPSACGPVIVIEPHTSKTSDSAPILPGNPYRAPVPTGSNWIAGYPKARRYSAPKFKYQPQVLSRQIGTKYV